MLPTSISYPPISSRRSCLNSPSKLLCLYPTNHTPHQPARPRRGPPCRCYSVFKHSMPLAAEEPIELEAKRSERYLPCASLVFFHFFKPITSPAFRPRPTVINLPPLLPSPPPPQISHHYSTPPQPQLTIPAPPASPTTREPAPAAATSTAAAAASADKSSGPTSYFSA